MLLNNFTLLYVEDDLSTQEAITIILEDEVRELYLARNGEEALEIFEDKKPDIILTDINMPKMNGIEMSKKIKEINYHTPIIVLTAFSDINSLRATIDIGIDKYIVKPILDFQKLLDTLESIAKILQSDIDKKQMEKIIQMQSKITAMGEMLGNIAHQWRQPLNVISSMTSAMKLKVSLGEELQTQEVLESSESILKQTQYLSQTIDDFRNFFSDDISLKHHFYINDAIKYIENLISDNYKNNFINLIINVQDHNIYQNQNQLSQALLNIFNNAKDAFLLNKIHHDKYVFIDVTNDEEHITISIQDNAGGIKEEAISKIFDPYFTTKHQSIGTGIGLYITHKIITKNFNGTIKVENKSFSYNKQEYKGANFIIKLKIEKLE